MKIGDLVSVPHWTENQTGIITSTKRLETNGIVRVLGSFGWDIDIHATELKVISESR